MNAQYAAQAALVVKALPHIEREGVFALKGGTAINLFELDLPRLSVDIDLTYKRITDRETAIFDINGALQRISQRLMHFGIENRLVGPDSARKIICAQQDAIIKIEPNYILRGTIFPTRQLANSHSAQQLFGMAKMTVLSRAELYGGKFCAALDRQHPRDLFDVAQFFKRHEITTEIKNGFLALALCHNRPLHELLNPILQDHATIFEQQFRGMSDTPFTYAEHCETFHRLRQELAAAMTNDDRQHLLDFISLQGSPDDFEIPSLSALPAIAWKRKNLEALRRQNTTKFAEQRDQLASLFDRL